MTDFAPAPERATRFEILLVEDQIKHRRLFEETLTEQLPVTVRTVTSVEEALAALTSPLSEAPMGLGAESLPDLVILDLELPGGRRGEEVLTRVKSDPRLRTIPVVILTGLSSFETQIKALELGADDFIEKGATPGILVARIRAQMRHKLAVDRLERMALERDLFAAGVLSDIGTIKGTILSSCRAVKDQMRSDPTGGGQALIAQFDKLTSVASQLGTYASDVIQSVRDTSRQAKIAAQEPAHLMDWVVQVLAAGETTAARLTVTASDALAPILADLSYLQLVFLNIARHAMLRLGDCALQITVSQTTSVDPRDPMQRKLLITRLVTNAPVPQPAELSRIFQPQSNADEDDSGLGMALAAKVMAKMSGRAWAEADSAGLAYCIELPAS